MHGAIRHLTAIGFAATSTGCTSWQPQTQPLPEVVAANRLGTLRVTPTDGSQYTISSPRMAGDSLTGFVIHGVEAAERRLASSQISRIEVRKSNPGATAALVIAGAAVMVGTVTTLKGMEEWSTGEP